MFGKKKESVDKTTGKKRTKKEMKHKEEQPQYYRSATGEITLNYCVYYMSLAEKIVYFLLAAIIGAYVGYLFYGGIGKNEFGEPTTLTYVLNTIVTLGCGFMTGKYFLPIRTKQIQVARQKKLRSQFRDMLEALSTALGAGQNVRDAFASVYNDLTNQYEETAFILKELYLINTGVVNGVNMEDLIADFARRSGSKDIKDFSDVFEICYRQGGNIRETVKNTCQIISDKMGIVEEIETTVSGSKNEQYIMLVMPVALIAMIKSTSPDFAANFTTPAGIASTTIGIVLFVVSYFLGTKLLDIKV